MITLGMEVMLEERCHLKLLVQEQNQNIRTFDVEEVVMDIKSAQPYQCSTNLVQVLKLTKV